MGGTGQAGLGAQFATSVQRSIDLIGPWAVTKRELIKLLPVTNLTSVSLQNNRTLQQLVTSLCPLSRKFYLLKNGPKWTSFLSRKSTRMSLIERAWRSAMFSNQRIPLRRKTVQLSSILFWPTSTSASTKLQVRAQCLVLNQKFLWSFIMPWWLRGMFSLWNNSLVYL